MLKLILKTHLQIILDYKKSKVFYLLLTSLAAIPKVTRLLPEEEEVLPPHIKKQLTMKQYTVDGRDNSTLNFNCQIDEEFYVLLQRNIDPDGISVYNYRHIDMPEMRSAWMMLNSTNMNHLGNEPMNTPMHSVQLQFSRLSERRGEGIQAVCEMQFHC